MTSQISQSSKKKPETKDTTALAAEAPSMKEQSNSSNPEAIQNRVKKQVGVFVVCTVENPHWPS